MRASEGDRLSFRQALGSFATGVTVVATRAASGQARAFTANSFTSVSLDPPLVLVCLSRASPSIDIFEQAASFSVSVLEAGQRHVSGEFASRDPAVKARAADGRLVADDVPFVDGSLATFICERERTIEAGDHVILLGRVVRFAAAEGQPLGYFRGAYVGIGPDAREIEQLPAALVVAGLLRVGGRVLLCRRPGCEPWELPATPLRHGERHDRALEKRFGELGVEASLSVPYSLFQEEGEAHTTFVFSLEGRGTVATGRREDGTETVLVGPGDGAWRTVRGPMRQALLQRHFDEMSSGAFSLYFDTLDGGSMVSLSGGPRSWSDPPPGAADGTGP